MSQAPVINLHRVRVERRLQAEGWRYDDAVGVSVDADDDAMVVFDLTVHSDGGGFYLAVTPDIARKVLHQLEAAIIRAESVRCSGEGG